MAPTVTHRLLDPDEHLDYVHAVQRGFGHTSSDDDLAEFLPTHELDRTFVAIDDTTAAASRIVGTCGANSFRMAVPGGTSVPVSGITAVTVRPTHRRQGILTTMMGNLLDQAAERGEPIAVLHASESAIYGRFGFGAASFWHGLRVDAGQAGFRAPFVDSGRVDHVSKDVALEIFPPFWDRYHATVPGELGMRTERWAGELSDLPGNREGRSERILVTHRDSNGELDGIAWYRMAPSWTNDGIAEGVLHVEGGPFALNDEAHLALWRALLDVDLMTQVESPKGRSDDPLRWALTNMRALRTTSVADGLWVRLLDIPVALSSRTYDRDGTIVLDITDGFRNSSAGLHRLTVADGIGTCEPVDATAAGPAPVRLDIAELGAIYLGGVHATELARAGRISADDPSDVDLLDVIFGTRRQPHNGFSF